MILQRPQPEAMPIEIEVADTPRVLSAINKSGCIAAVWQRHPLSSFQTWLNALDQDVLPQARLILRPETTSEAIAHACQQAGLPDGPKHRMLIGDITALAHIFSKIASSEYVQLGLRVFDAHQQIAPIELEKPGRLVCLYRGPRLTLTSVASETTTETPVSNCVPFIVSDGTRYPFEPHFVKCRVVHSESAPEISLMLTLDPVRAAMKAPKSNAKTYH